jgi:lipopolysaccharide export system protein LptA
MKARANTIALLSAAIGIALTGYVRAQDAVTLKPPQQQAVSPAAAPAKKETKSGSGGGSMNMGHHDTSAPINVSSDNFEGDMQTKVGTYIGNVIIIQGDFKLRADKVAIHEVGNKPSTMNGFGHVLFTTPDSTASGDTGVYDLGPRTITLDGKVVLTKEKNVMRGTHAVMNLDTGISHITAKDMPGGRVQGLFIPPPKDDKNQSQTPSKTPPK